MESKLTQQVCGEQDDKVFNRKAVDWTKQVNVLW